MSSKAQRQDAPGKAGLRPRRRGFAVAAIHVGSVMAMLAISIVSVALPAIQADLGPSLSGLQWVVGAYTLCLSSCILSAGPLADRYGRKRIWLMGIALFVIGSIISATAQTLEVLIAGPAVQGMAGALVTPVFVAMFMASATFGRLIRGFGVNALLISGCALLGGSMLAMTQFTPTTSNSLHPSSTRNRVGRGRHGECSDGEDRGCDPTVNALSQSGMTIGIALLGTVMSAGAVTSLDFALAKSGVPNAALVATEAVQRHETPASLTMSPGAFQDLLRAAYAHGFALAALTAGFLGSLAVLVLVVARRREPGSARP